MMDQEYLKQLSDSLMIGAPRITPDDPNDDYLSNLSSYLRTGLKPEPRVIKPVPTDYGIPEDQLKTEITDLKAKGHTLYDVQSAIDSSSEITLKDQAKKLAKDLFGQQFVTSETPVIKRATEAKQKQEQSPQMQALRNLIAGAPKAIAEAAIAALEPIKYIDPGYYAQLGLEKAGKKIGGTVGEILMKSALPIGAAVSFATPFPFDDISALERLAKETSVLKIEKLLTKSGLTLEKAKELAPAISKTQDVGEIKNILGIGNDLSQILRGTKGMTAADITKTYPDIKLTKDVPATDIYGNKVKIPEGEALTPYELKGNKILLQDGETYVVSKNQFENIKGQAVSKEAKPFAPELAGTEESIRGEFTSVKEIEKYAKETDLSYASAQNVLNQRFIREGKKGVKYEAYQLPDGKSYKEILIKAPGGFLNKSRNEIANELFDKDFTGLPRTKKMIVEEEFDKGLQKAETTPTFKSSHWDEPNVISHLRMNERTYQGKKVAF